MDELRLHWPDVSDVPMVLNCGERQGSVGGRCPGGGRGERERTGLVKSGRTREGESV
jgi:hypothetical protein